MAIKRQLDKEYTVAGQIAWAMARKLERFQVSMVTKLKADDFGSLPLTIYQEPQAALRQFFTILPAGELIYLLPQARKLFISPNSVDP